LFSATHHALLLPGLDITDGEAHGTSGHYDLMGSEALSTYAYGILNGDIPAAAWEKLKTAAFRDTKEGPTPIKSFFGTAFEIFLPRMFMKAPPGSALDVAAKSMLKAQVDAGRNGMFGTSEADTAQGY